MKLLISRVFQCKGNRLLSFKAIGRKIISVFSSNKFLRFYYTFVKWWISESQFSINLYSLPMNSRKKWAECRQISRSQSITLPLAGLILLIYKDPVCKGLDIKIKALSSHGSEEM